jgi:hypothetical protein
MGGILMAAFLAPLLGFAGPEVKRPAKRPALCGIKAVYVAAYSEPSVKVEEAVKKRTWLKVVSSPEKANAVLEVHETWSEPDPSTHGGQMTISAILKNKDGNLWSGSQPWGEGSVNPDPRSAAKELMSKLNEDAGGCK